MEIVIANLKGENEVVLFRVYIARIRPKNGEPTRYEIVPSEDVQNWIATAIV